MSEFIQVTNLSIEYVHRGKRKKVFNQLNFDLKKNKLTSLLGPSGCGKTSLLKVIAGLLRPTSGAIVCNASKSAPIKVSYVPQTPTLLPFRTILENVILPLELGHQIDYKYGMELLKQLGLGAYKNSYPNALSIGMQQKVSIARALVTRPQLILMDEPFSALDEMSREKITEEFYQWFRYFTPTILFVTHNIEEAVFLSNYVLVFSNKPSTVLVDIPIPLPAHRTHAMRTTQKFFTISKRIRRVLRT